MFRPTPPTVIVVEPGFDVESRSVELGRLFTSTFTPPSTTTSIGEYPGQPARAASASWSFVPANCTLVHGARAEGPRRAAAC